MRRALVLGFLALLPLVGCDAKPDKRLVTTIEDPVAPPGAAVADPAAPVTPAPPTTPPGPAKPVTAECGAVSAFNLLNYTMGLVEGTGDRDKMNDAVTGLDQAATSSGDVVPELRTSFRAVANYHRAHIDDKPEPEPGAGEPKFADALYNIGTYFSAHC